MSKTKLTYTAKRGIANDGTELALVGVNDGGRSLPVNLITDSGFDTGNGWTLLESGWSIANGVASVIADGSNVSIGQVLTFTSIGAFDVSVDCVAYTTGTGFLTYTAGTAVFTSDATPSFTSTGKISRKFYVTTAGNITIRIQANSGAVLSIDNFTCYAMNDETVGNEATELYPSGNAASPSGESNSTGNWATNSNAVLSSVASPVQGGNYAISGESNTTPTNTAGIYFDLSTLGLTDGDNFTLSFYARHNGTGGAWAIRLGNTTFVNNAYVTMVTLTSTDTTYTQYSITMTYSSSCRYLGARENSGTNDGGVYIDQIEVALNNDLISNGAFYDETSTYAWTLGTSWSVSGGVASVSAPGAFSAIYQLVTFPVAGTYMAAFEVTSISAGTIYSYTYAAGTAVHTVDSTPFTNTPGWVYRKYYVHSPGTLYISARASSTAVATIDNYSCWLIEDDQSAADDHGFEVHGQLRYLQVAPGADLRAWQGFSATNYLEQPYTSALDFGSTGDFSISCWVKVSSFVSAEHIHNSTGTGNTQGINIYISSTGYPTFVTRESSTNSTATANITLTKNEWAHLVFVRSTSGAIQAIYINGVLNVSSTVTARNVSSGEPNTTGFALSGGNGAVYSQFSIKKIYGSALTASQIKTIYDKEKVLFEPYAAYQLENASYDIEFAAQQKTQSQQIVKDSNTALDGTIESLVHRSDYYHDITTDLIPFNEVSPYREFLYSVRGDETFTANLGAGVIPAIDINVSLEDTQITEQREGTSTYIRFTFRLRER